jgi:hypothetical protein
MSEQKKIKINIADFSFNNTKKKKPKDKPDSKNSIKVKSSVSKPKTDTLKKRTLLKMIRQQQEDQYNKLFGTTSDTKPTIVVQPTAEMTEMTNELEKAKEYLNNLKEKQEKNRNTHNTTIKRTPNMPVIIPPTTSAVNYNENNNRFTPVIPTTSPQYGCLKNGNLPTYKTFIRTSKHQPSIHIGNPVKPSSLSPIHISMHSDMPKPSLNPVQVSIPPINNPFTQKITEQKSVINTEMINSKLNNELNKVAALKQSAELLTQLKQNNRPKRMLHRKTVRRTYKIGRSSKFPKVTVLVSNKTIRNNTTTKSQLLKQTSIQDVKKGLIKRGLIKAGCTTPNDVLRKMYESVMMICGDVQNHNPDNLLYNYMNDKAEH